MPINGHKTEQKCCDGAFGGDSAEDVRGLCRKLHLFGPDELFECEFAEVAAKARQRRSCSESAVHDEKYLDRRHVNCGFYGLDGFADTYQGS